MPGESLSGILRTLPTRSSSTKLVLLDGIDAPVCPDLQPTQAILLRSDSLNRRVARTISAVPPSVSPTRLELPLPESRQRPAAYMVRRVAVPELQTLDKQAYAISACIAAAGVALAEQRLTPDDFNESSERMMFVLPALALVETLCEQWHHCGPGEPLRMPMEGFVASPALHEAHAEALSQSVDEPRGFPNALRDAVCDHLAGKTQAAANSLAARLAAGVMQTVVVARCVTADTLFWSVPEARCLYNTEALPVTDFP